MFLLCPNEHCACAETILSTVTEWTL